MKATLRVALCVVCLLVFTLGALADSPEIGIVSPEEGITLAARTVAVEASFVCGGDTAVEQLEFAVDGVTVDARTLDPAQKVGRVSFSWAASRYPQGKHILSIVAVDSAGEVGEAAITVLLQSDLRAPDRGVRLTTPATGDTVSGKTTIRAEVDDPEPATYVIFLVDDVFRAMSNVRPFAYVWDTTRCLNGVYLLQVKACVAGQWEHVSPVVEVNVNNPSGATAMRAPQVTARRVAASPLEPPARAGSPVLPAPLHSAEPSPPISSAVLPSPEIALPGTAPFVSASGELVTPALPKDPTLVAKSTEMAALPSSSPALAGVAPSVADRQVLTATPEPSVVPLDSALPATCDTIATAGDAASQSPSEVTIVPAETTRLPAAIEKESTSAPLEMAMLPAPEKQKLPPAEPVPSSVTVEAAPASTTVVLPVVSPKTSEIEIAMLPPRPVEQRPTPSVAAEPAPLGIAYVVRGTDRLERVAAEVGVPATEIARANNLAPSATLHAGQTLLIPSTPVYFNDRALLADAPTVITDGRTIVPFRAVVEEAGGTVQWDSEAKRASAVASGHELAVTIGSDRASVDASEVVMGQAAALRCDRTVVPLRFLGDALDLVLQYEDGVVHIASGF
ncbi:MAG: LysM peptidoglycan-binding domain-containing protein [Armatimonadetes bacterium]|nr:LysM peptidoglycan-binding domain-containing protein [Armatimonadota bacterium]